MSDLADLATVLDIASVVETVGASITATGVLPTWERLVQPVWASLVDDAGRVPFLEERLFVQAVSHAMTTARRATDRARPRVLLACADGEDQSLPQEVVAAALAESGTGSCVLGARVPPQALLAAVHRLPPAVVVVWSQSGETADPGQIRSLASYCPGPAVIAGGPGWDPTDLAAPAVASPDVATVLELTMRLLAKRPVAAVSPTAVRASSDW